MDDLRKAIIRLAHSKPELRGELLPLLKEAATKPTHREFVSQVEKALQKVPGVKSAEYDDHNRVSGGEGYESRDYHFVLSLEPDQEGHIQTRANGPLTKKPLTFKGKVNAAKLKKALSGTDAYDISVSFPARKKNAIPKKDKRPNDPTSYFDGSDAGVDLYAAVKP